MLHLFTHYIYRSGQERNMDSWTLFTQSSILPSFIKLFDGVGGTVQLLETLSGRELCPKSTLRP